MHPNYNGKLSVIEKQNQASFELYDLLMNRAEDEEILENYYSAISFYKKACLYRDRSNKECVTKQKEMNVLIKREEIEQQKEKMKKDFQKAEDIYKDDPNLAKRFLESSKENARDLAKKEFIEKINSVGVKVSDTAIKIIKINKKIEYSEGTKSISIQPTTLSLDIDFQLKYENEFIGNQRNKVKIYEDNLTDIFNSRTYCLFEDIEKIKKLGLAKGGSLENAIVVKGKEILNKSDLKILSASDLNDAAEKIVKAIK